MSAARRYALLGALLGLGSPAGLLVLRSLPTAGEHAAGWLSVEVSAFGTVYLYTGIGTVLAFSLMGWWSGRSVDRQARRAEVFERSMDRFRRLSRTDGLTGLLVHRQALKRLSEELHRAVRYGYPLGGLFVDVDDFKALNDHHGHLFGDQALAAVSRVLRDCLRESDVLGRYGGDEFIAFLPHASLPQAYRVGERVRESVERLGLKDGRGPVSMTVSVGVFASGPAGISVEGFLSLADEALRRSKACGKNRTVIGGAAEIIPVGA